MTNDTGNVLWSGMRTETDVPVFEVIPGVQSEYSNGDRLPGIWVTRPISDNSGMYLGRFYEVPYPSDDYDDVYGDDALYYGGGYYDEAMSYSDPADRQKRIDCFRAAELLYRHAAGRGNAVANLCLGYVYSYDRCEGDYWVGADGTGEMAGSFPAGPDAKPTAGTDSPGPERVGASGGIRSYPREQRAFECLSIAAEAKICEACYKLGDMYKRGVGCTPDAGEAFRWYARASELSAGTPPVILGSVALRLAGCYEEGFGCNQSFEHALGWYRKAVAGLAVAVESGDSWYAKALAGARAGVKRCEQELVV